MDDQRWLPRAEAQQILCGRVRHEFEAFGIRDLDDRCRRRAIHEFARLAKHLEHDAAQRAVQRRAFDLAMRLMRDRFGRSLGCLCRRALGRRVVDLLLGHDAALEHALHAPRVVHACCVSASRAASEAAASAWRAASTFRESRRRRAPRLARRADRIAPRAPRRAARGPRLAAPATSRDPPAASACRALRSLRCAARAAPAPRTSRQLGAPPVARVRQGCRAAFTPAATRAARSS